MNLRQQTFVLEYLKDLNATQAAIRAGYSQKTAGQMGERLLKNVEIAQAVGAKAEKKLDKLEVTTDRIIAEYAKIAFVDMREVVKVAAQAVSIEDSINWPEHVAGAVAEVSEGKDGLKIKMHSKVAALDALAKINALYKDTKEVNVNVTLEQLVSASIVRVEVKQ